MTVREGALVALAAVAFGLAFSYPVLGRSTGSWTLYDWDYFSQLAWAAHASVVRFHQLPLWNPYKCGGMPLLGNPESRILTPFFLLALLVGPDAGQRLEVPLHLALGWSGGYVLARIQGLGPLAGIVCGSVFAGSSWVYLHVAVGHLVFLPFLYLPWIGALVWLGFERRRLVSAAVAGLVLALSFGEGGVYAVLVSLLLVGVLALTVAAARRSLWPVATAVALAAFALGFAAVKLLPAYDVMPQAGRLGGEVNPVGALVTALFARAQDVYRPSVGPFGFWEYGAYLGPWAALLAAAGIVRGPRRAMLPWMAAAAVVLLLALGEFLGNASPWALLRRLPGYSAARIPSRLLIPFVLSVGVLAAFGADALWRQRPPLGAIVASLLATGVVIDAWAVGPHNLRHVFGGWHRPAVPASPVFRQVATRDAFHRLLPYTKANKGAVQCYENWLFNSTVKGADQDGYRGEQYLLGPGEVGLVEWSPNGLAFDVRAEADTVLVVNQNYDAAWRVAGGLGEVFSREGLIAVAVPAGASRVRLAYSSRAFRIGGAITTLTGVVLLILWRREAGSSRARGSVPSGPVVRT